jgi:hypothetical protein
VSVSLAPFAPAVELQKQLDEAAKLPKDILEKTASIALNQRQIEALQLIGSPEHASERLAEIEAALKAKVKPVEPEKSLFMALAQSLPGLTGFDKVKVAQLAKAKSNPTLTEFIKSIATPEQASEEAQKIAAALKVVDPAPSQEEKKRLNALREPLAALSGNFESKKAGLIENKEANIAKAEKLRTEYAEALVEVKKLIAANPYNELLSDQDMRGAWTRDRQTQKSVRAVESDIADMKRKLDAYESRVGDAVPTPVKPCLAEMQSRLREMETHVDNLAHRADCHVCHTQNGIIRTGPAKELMLAKFRSLETLALSDTAPTGQEGDHKVAVELKRLRATPRTGPKDAGSGKMLGVLTATKDGETRHYYAFSGDLEGAETAGWSPAIPLDGDGASLRSIGGKVVGLDTLNTPQHKGTPHGVCSAPKLIQQALADGFTPTEMAEMWYGDGATNTHGEFVVSCSTCMGNIGFQLCRTCTL